jgi:microcystin-dependent protein
VGDIKWVAHGDVPAGWMEYNGQSVSATEYPDLFAKLGHTFGGDGDTFNLPDLQDRVVLSKSGSRCVGDSGGEESHCLSIDEMPCHDHGGEVNGNVDVSGSISGVAGYDIGTCCVCDCSPTLSVISCLCGCDGYPNTMPVCGTFSGSGSFSANIQTSSCGGDQAHNNMQPYLVLKAVIKVAA